MSKSASISRAEAKAVVAAAASTGVLLVLRGEARQSAWRAQCERAIGLSDWLSPQIT